MEGRREPGYRPCKLDQGHPGPRSVCVAVHEFARQDQVKKLIIMDLQEICASALRLELMEDSDWDLKLESTYTYTYICMYMYIYIYATPPPQLSTFFVAFQGTRGNMFPNSGVMFQFLI